MPFERDENSKKIHFSFNNLLATLIFLVVSAYFFLITFWKSRADTLNDTVLVQILTIMISTLNFVVGYYFGSSKSSTAKDQKISDMTDTATKIALNSATPPTTVDTINTENISGDVTAENINTTEPKKD